MLQSDRETCVWPDLIDCMDIPNPNTGEGRGPKAMLRTVRDRRMGLYWTRQLGRWLSTDIQIGKRIRKLQGRLRGSQLLLRRFTLRVP